MIPVIVFLVVSIMFGNRVEEYEYKDKINYVVVERDTLQDISRRYLEKGYNISKLQLRMKLIYLLQHDFEGIPVYLFLAQRSGENTQVCRTFFPKANKDYTQGQPQYTLLKKEKHKMCGIWTAGFRCKKHQCFLMPVMGGGVSSQLVMLGILLFGQLGETVRKLQMTKT